MCNGGLFRRKHYLRPEFISGEVQHGIFWELSVKFRAFCKVRGAFHVVTTMAACITIDAVVFARSVCAGISSVGVSARDAGVVDGLAVSR